MSAEKVNAATRIASVLEAAAKAGGGNGLPGAMARAMNAAPDSPEYLIGLATLAQQYIEIELVVQQREMSDRARAVYQRALQKLRPFLSPVHLANHTNSTLKALTNEIDQLFVISDLLPAEDQISDGDKLAELVKKLEELRAEIGDIGVSEEVAVHLKALFDTLLMALRSHHILGPDGLAKAFGSVAFELTRTMNVQSLGGSANTKAAGWFGKSVKAMKALGALIVWTGAVAGAGSELLEFGGDVTGLLSDASTEATAAAAKKN